MMFFPDVHYGTVQYVHWVRFDISGRVYGMLLSASLRQMFTCWSRVLFLNCGLTKDEYAR